MRMDHENNKRILLILTTLSILISSLILMKNKDNNNDTHPYYISEDMLDYNTEGPSKLSVLLEQYLSDEEKEYIMTNDTIPLEFVNNLIKRIDEEKGNTLARKYIIK